jgi:hypothetical protein
MAQRVTIKVASLNIPRHEQQIIITLYSQRIHFPKKRSTEDKIGSNETV